MPLYSRMPEWAQELAPIVILLLVVWAMIARLPKIDLGHSAAFVRRRRLNWFPLGLTYAFLYMGRYNLTVAKNAFGDQMTKEDFGIIFGVGALVYGLAFLLNGPLADILGGRKTILIAAVGSAVMNLAMGAVTLLGWGGEDLVLTFSILYGLNMYFQSFGAVSIVKVNSAWFHVNERGVFGGIFGILISLGIYFAYDWGGLIVEHLETEWVFFIPAAILLGWFVVDLFLVRDHPSEAGHADIETGDASTGEEGVSLWKVAARILTTPIIFVIALIEFCSGFLRNAIMQWGAIFGKEAGLSETFVFDNWGMLLCVAGITGGMFAGVISDRVFGSRRGPVAAVLYGGMLVGSLAMYALLDTPWLGWLIIAMSMCIIGVHGMLSGTASMDFGGKKGAGIAVGLIDGFVYLGTAAQGFVLGGLLPKGDAAADAANWTSWPLAMMPVALVGLAFAAVMWNAKPKPRARAPVEEAEAAA